MKRIYTAIALLIITAGICTAEFLCVSRNAEKYISEIESIQLAMEEGDTEAAMEYATKINADWQETVSVVDMLLYHDYVDEIGSNLSELEVYIAYGEEADLYATCERAKNQLRTLRDSELPSAENII